MLAFAASDIETFKVNGSDDPKTLPGTVYDDSTTVYIAWSPEVNGSPSRSPAPPPTTVST